MNTSNASETKTKYVGMCCAPSAGGAIFWGILLVLLGGLGLLSAIMPLEHLARYILPAFLVLWGGYILFSLHQLHP
jgi:hypothetical protein